ncbi:nitroreductase [uncultured Lactobacillus sp.]|uniref:nitroreductase n=1 Tax=uncultured Lactobacillus sp. TaxID=153152 RepID=UPI00280557FD|nr:nitroreductase [uncultured Lactobacillus sp.]
MDVKEAISSRHSTRLFDSNKQVSEDDLKEIVRLAQQAPSWVDSQPWKVYIATGEKLKQIKEKHRENVEQGVKANPDWPTTHRKDWAEFPRENMARHNADTEKFWETNPIEGVTRADLQERLYDAPVICYLTIPKNSNRWSTYDLGAFGQTLMLAAKGLGIDSMPAYEIVKFPESIRKIMNIPDDETIGMGIALGYGDKSTRVNEYHAHRVDLDKMLKIED